MATSFLEMLLSILLSLGGSAGWGIPVGMPPEAPEAYMYDIAPEKCLYFSTWATMAKPDPNSDNMTEKLMADREVTHFMKKLNSLLNQLASGEGKAEPQNVTAKIGLEISRIVLTRATTVYLEKFEIREDAPHLEGAMAVSLGPHLDDVSGYLVAFEKAFATELKVQDVTIQGSRFYQHEIEEGDNLITWGIHQGRLLIGFGDGAIEKIVANGKTPTPQWLKDTVAELKVERISTVSRVDLKEVTKFILSTPDAHMFFPIVTKLGFANFANYRTVTGFEGDRVVERSDTQFEGKRTGIMAALGSSPLSEKSLNKMPNDALFAAAVKFDLKKVFNMIEDDPSVFGGMPQHVFDDGVEMIEGVIGGSLKDDLIGALGDTIYLYTSPHDGGAASGWVLAVDVDQEMQLAEIMQRIMGFAKGAMAAGGRRGQGFQMNSQEISGHQVYYFETREIPFALSWSLANGQLLFSIFPQSIKGHLARQHSGKGFADNAEVKMLLAASKGSGNNGAISYLETRELVKLVYPLATSGVTSMLVEEEIQSKFNFSTVDFPSVRSLTEHLRPTVGISRFEPDRISTYARRVQPTASVASSLPALAAMMLPAVSSARLAARRTVSMNNLKQIGLGLHNYNDVYRGFPAPHTLDKNGKALLSWRVHILPYMEQQALYEKFHFDEAWDSEHNKALIAFMPDVYLIPGNKNEGKAYYLGVAGKGGAFHPDKATQKGNSKGATGTRFREMLDGSSNTAMVVEVNEKNTVIWTKPGDFDAPEMEPIARMIGNWKNGFNILMGDGSVQFIRDDIDLGTLKKLFDMKDGLPIEWDELRR